jgi:hypothetical protein
MQLAFIYSDEMRNTFERNENLQRLTIFVVLLLWCVVVYTRRVLCISH